MKEKRRRSALILAGLLLLASGLTGCRRVTNPGGEAETDSPVTDGSTQPEARTGTEQMQPETAPEAETVTEPTAGTYDKKYDTAIRLTGTDAEITGGGVSVDGSFVTVTAPGTYLVTGSLVGQLVVDVPDGAVDESEGKAKVKLILNGVSVTNPNGPALLIPHAPGKVILCSAAESVNLFEDGDGYIVPDDEQTADGLYPNACIYADADIRMDGEGVIQITGHADRGINTKDDLLVAGGSVTVTSPGTAVRGNDSFRMTGGRLTVTVTGEGDGIKTANTEKEGKGTLSVEGGSLFVTAVGDGLSAATDLTVSSGSLVVTTLDAGGKALAEASAASGSTGRGGFGGRGGPGGPGGMNEGNASKSSISAKGLKAGGTLTVSGGKMTITAVDDGLHANDTVQIQAGEVWIRSGDDGMHADRVLTISGGITEIAQSYEGLEAETINVLGGTNRITASDDGMNASNGTSSGGPGGPGDPGGPGGFRPGGPGERPGERPGGGGQPGAPGQDGPTAAQDGGKPLLNVGGGYTVVHAAGDGIDSNGDIVMTGGELFVFGPTDNGNGPIDFGDGNCSMTISGGTLLAVGSSGMAEAPVNAGQAVFSVSTRQTMKAGTTVGLIDADGRVICAFRLPKQIQSFVYSSPALTAGASYTLVSGGTSAEIADGILYPNDYAGYETIGTAKAK